MTPELLPAPLKGLSSEDRQRVVEEKAQRRDQLKKEIQALSSERAAYIGAKVKEAGGMKDSLDMQLYETVREQAAEKGLAYPAAAPAY